MNAPAVHLVRLDVGGEARWAVRTQVGDAPMRVGIDDLLRLSLDEARAVVASAVPAAGLGGALLPPVDSQEVWGTGVTYERSRAGRVAESTDGGIYDRVYLARRPEIFFKATAQRVVGDGQPVGIRADSPWNAPEPELGLVLNAAGEIFGYVVGDDVSSRSIEGENPLYLTQAKVYERSCALGPGIVPAWAAPARPFDITLRVQRGRGRLRGVDEHRKHHPSVRGPGRLADGRARLPGRRGPTHRHGHRAGGVFQSPRGGRRDHRYSRHRHPHQSGRPRRPGSRPGAIMTVRQERHGPGDTQPEELNQQIGAAVAAAHMLIGSRPSDRAAWLEQLATRLDAAADDLVPLAAQETHLGLDRLQGELKRTTFQLRLFAEVLRDGSFLQATIDHANPAWPMGPRPDLRRMLRPIGPVAVYAASNFPFAFSVAGGDTASALAAGCPVLLKANPSHPKLSAATGEGVRRAGRGGSAGGDLRYGDGLRDGIALVKDPRIRAASFTGSLRGGRALFDLAVSRPEPIPFYGELGSVNPAFVAPDAAAQRADDVAAGFVGSMSLGNGQFCTKPGLLFVPAGSGLEHRVAALAGARPAAPMLSEHIRSGYSEALAQLAERPGVRVIAGKPRPEGDPAPTVLATTVSDLLADSEAMTQECFGPAALVVSYGSEDELLAAARVFDGQLTATIHSSSQEPVTSALLEVLTERVGRVVWNGWPTGVSVTYAQHHGGPYPATTSVQTTSVGTAAIDRFLRPVT